MRSKRPAAILVAALLFLLLLPVYQLRVSFQDQLRSAETSTRNLAALLDARLEATLRHTDANLLALIRGIPPAAMSPLTAHSYQQEIDARLSSHLSNADELSGYRIHAANGGTLYSSDRAHAQRVNIADRPYFRLLRDTPEAGLVFSDTLTGRSTGRWNVVIARAIRDTQGKFLGTAHGLLDLGHYQKQFQSLDLGADGFVVLRRSDTQEKIVGWPDPANADDAPTQPDEPIAQRLSAGEHSFGLRHASAHDGVMRVVGVQSLLNYPFYFAVGVSEHEVLAGWRGQVVLVGASITLLLLLVGVLIVRLGRMRVREADILNTLAVSEAQFASLAQRLPVGIARFDASGRCMDVNKRLAAMTGRRREELLQSERDTFIHPDDHAQIQRVWAAAATQRSPVAFECRLVRPGGELMHLAGEVQAEADADGRTLAYTVAQTDITASKQVEAELRIAKLRAESADVAKTTFLTAASHDLRQPVP